MFLFKKKRRAKDLDIPRLRLQVEMVQRLLDSGYSWDQIFNAIGFSEVWMRFVKSRFLENQNQV